MQVRHLILAVPALAVATATQAATITFQGSGAINDMTFEVSDPQNDPPTLDAAGSYATSAAISGDGFDNTSGAFRYTVDALDSNGADDAITRNSARGYGVEEGSNDIGGGTITFDFALEDLGVDGDLTASSDFSPPSGQNLALTGFTISESSTPSLSVDGGTAQTFGSGTSFDNLNIAISDGTQLAFARDSGDDFRLRSLTFAVVPEPASLALLAAGGLLVLPRRRRR
jgi:hypothetical protein